MGRGAGTPKRREAQVQALCAGVRVGKMQIAEIVNCDDGAGFTEQQRAQRKNVRRNKQNVRRMAQDFSREPGMRPQAWERDAPQCHIRAEWRQLGGRLIAIQRVAIPTIMMSQRRQQFIGVVFRAGAHCHGKTASVDSNMELSQIVPRNLTCFERHIQTILRYHGNYTPMESQTNFDNIGNVRRSIVIGYGAWRVLAANYWYRAAALTHLMIAGNRQPVIPPADKATLMAEDVAFPSSDGVALRGWFIPRAGHDGRSAPVIVFVHGWPWNRQGNRSGHTVIPDATVDFLGPARALRAAGFHTLLFDLRNHGESGAALPVTFGVREANDLVGAVAMLRQRDDVDGARIGVLGYSMGANAAIYGIPRCRPIPAAVVVQPVSIAAFARNFSRELLGPAGPTLLRLAQPVHQAFGAPPLRDITPATAAPRLGDTTVLYIQGSGDRWGSMHDVQTMAAATPHALAVVAAPSQERYSGYLYVNTHVRDIIAFFADHLRG